MSDTSQTRIERRLRAASVLVLAGLAFQLATLLVNHPLSFLVFIFVGSPLVLAGTAAYLWSLVPRG